MSQTRIEWATHVWNPVTGCSPISAGCQNCYAARMAKRLAGRVGYPADDPFKVTLHPERLDEPQHWRKPRMVFVCSMGDLFHDNVPDEYLEQVWDVMEECSQHTFLVLTKRPERALDFIQHWINLNSDDSVGWRHPEADNIWIGVTVENQNAANERIPLLLSIPATRRFVSCEPLLEDVDLAHPYTGSLFTRCSEEDVAKGLLETCEGHYDRDVGLTSTTWDEILPGIHWVIAGGETGPRARPMHPDWVRGLRYQANAAGVPFFFKAWGEWVVPEDGARSCRVCGCTEHMPCEGLLGEPCFWVEKDLCSACVGKPVPKGDRPVKYLHVGKARAGRRLDGREWNEVPER